MSGATRVQAHNAAAVRTRALGRLKPGEMNKSEAAYAEHLKARQVAGEVLWWAFNAIKLRLADNCFLSPDFALMFADGRLELHDVKGNWFQDDAKVKMKVAASSFPIPVMVVRPRAKRDGGGWSIEEF